MGKHQRKNYQPGDMIYADGGIACFAKDLAPAPVSKPAVPALPVLTKGNDLAIAALKKGDYERAERIKKITSIWYWC